MKIEIVICTERGYLEAQSKLLIYSIRKFGGILKDVDIFSYKPRKGPSLKKSTIDFFKENKVEHIDLELNTDYPHYPLANKPIVGAHREKLSQADVLVFLDSDTFFLNSPDFISTIKPGQLFMRPVDVKNVGTDLLLSDENGEYWRSIYKTLNVTNYNKVTTTVDNKEILEYYNSGMIISSVTNNLFQEWKMNFDKVMNLSLTPRKGLFFVEQSVLSATISGMSIEVSPIPKGFNFPIHFMDGIRNPLYLVEKTSDVGHVHYHKLFKNKNGKNPVYAELNKSLPGRAINEKLIAFKVLRKDSSKLQTLKNKLKYLQNQLKLN